MLQNNAVVTPTDMFLFARTEEGVQMCEAQVGFCVNVILYVWISRVF